MLKISNSLATERDGSYLSIKLTSDDATSTPEDPGPVQGDGLKEWRGPVAARDVEASEIECSDGATGMSSDPVFFSGSFKLPSFFMDACEGFMPSDISRRSLVVRAGRTRE